MDDIINSLPFTTKGIDSDNGSEFINVLLAKYCADNKIVFTRSREYKKDDNAHIEQKNFTHVRKMIGYARYDTMEAVNAINDLYKNELDLFQNLFQPSVKLKEKIRIGSRIKRVYDEAMTPLDRLLKLGNYNKAKVEFLIRLRGKMNPFEISEAVERKIEKIYALANRSVRTSFCPKNVYRPKLVRSLLKPDEHMGTGIGVTKVFSDDVAKIKKTYLKEVMLQTR